MTGAEREAFAMRVMKEVRRWPGVQMRAHLNPLAEEAIPAAAGRLPAGLLSPIARIRSIGLQVLRQLDHTERRLH